MKTPGESKLGESKADSPSFWGGFGKEKAHANRLVSMKAGSLPIPIRQAYVLSSHLRSRVSAKGSEVTPLYEF
jgi:hypothetical protein